MLLQPSKSENCDLPLNLLSIDHNFGYDSERYYNLRVMSGPVLVYITARFLHFFDVQTKIVTLRRSNTAEGIGQITSHPILDHLAVAENGINGSVLIYDWPSLSVVAQLEGGAEIGYSSIRYNTDGSLLATVSSAPDYLLTLWKWENAEILLQAKAYEQEIYAVSFSNSNPTQLATCGVGHLKVWQMSETFTGLKLEEESGRFGKTETCDLIDVLPLADGSCATGSPWGNVLVWAEGSIRLQMLRNGQLPCHSAPITHLQHFYQSLLTAGMDGAVRIWNYETLETADPTEENPFIETEPLFELFIGEHDASANILGLVKATPEQDDSLWFAQDAKGAVWRLDISMNASPSPPERVFWCHSGPVVAMQTSLNQPVLLTLGSDSKLIVFNYESKTLESHMEFNSAGTCLKWIPSSVCPAGNMLICGFADGALRLLRMNDLKVYVVQALKPHSRAVVGVAVSQQVIISASRDATIFLFKCLTKEDTLELIPLGFCKTVSPASNITFRNETSLLVGCESWQIMIFTLPTNLERIEDNNTFLINLQSEILDIELVNKYLQERNEANSKIKEITFLWPISNENFWFSIDNKLIRYSFEEREVVGVLDDVIPRGTTISSFYHWKHGKCLFFGLSDGRLHAVQMDDDGSLTEEWWSCGVHESSRGSVRCITASWDEKMLLSCGDDSAVFSYNLHSYPQSTIITNPPQPSKCEFTHDIEDTSTLTLEESKLKTKLDETKDLENKRKQIVFETLNELKDEYKEIINSNKELPDEVKFSSVELIVDERIVTDLNASLCDKKQLIYLKMARDVEKSERFLEKLRSYFLNDIETMITRIGGINCDSFVETFRLRKLNKEFHTRLAEIQQLTENIKKQGSTQSAPNVLEVVMETQAELPDSVESLVKQVSAVGDVGKNRKLTALCRQRKSRRTGTAERKAVWDQLMSRAPNPNIADPRDERAIEKAKANMGDYKLKTSPDYKVSDGQNMTAISVNKTLLVVHQRVYKLKSEFNNRVLKLRSRKQHLIEKHKIYREKLKEISKEIPKTLITSLPELPSVIEHLEFPENTFLISQKHKNNQIIDDKVDDIKPDSGSSNDSNTEIEQYKLSSKLKLQSNIINEIEKDIDNFDNDLKKLKDEKIGLEVDVKFLDLFLLKLNREILLLKIFENDENNKLTTSFNLLKAKQETQFQLNDLSEKINEKLNEIQELKDKTKILTINFLEIIAENKYYEFLKKIYKKKYKPPKIKIEDSDDSLSSESDSESDMDEDKSIDSKELVLAKIRESICPENCDRELYLKTFEERSLRHNLELTTEEKQLEIEKLMKMFENLTKEIDKIDFQYEIAQKDVDCLQREKQRQLNEIETVVVLKLSQFQNFKDDLNLEDINYSLVINTNLLSDLYSRTADLNREINEEKERYDENKLHLKRMGIDIRYMEDLVLELNKDIDGTMMIKFGTKVDLNEMEEAVVKKLVAEMNYIPFELEKQLNIKLQSLQEELKEKTEKCAGHLVENTKRCNLLTLLKDEKNNLDDVLIRQECKKPTQKSNSDDTHKLRETVSMQMQKIQSLKEEISCYKMKSRSASSKETLIAQKVQRMMMETPDGTRHPISAQLRDQLLIIAADLQELCAEINDDQSTQTTWDKLKKLVEEFMDGIPESALHVMWSRLSMGSDADLDIMLEDRQVVLRAAQMITLMVQPIVTSTAPPN